MAAVRHRRRQFHYVQLFFFLPSIGGEICLKAAVFAAIRGRNSLSLDIFTASPESGHIAK
jgi:hypothetical protein